MAEPATVEAPKPPALVNLTIDDRPVSVPKGTNVVVAAKKLGIHIPHYCFHEKLTVAGNCRMCLIEMGTPRMSPERKPVLKPDGTPEIGWIPRPQIGCATTVSEGMAVRTRSPMVKECREGVMEFLLINHPLDCPICDQAGECHLQEYSVEFGTGASRFVEPKVHKPKNVRLGPRVTLDDERCVMCSRCIRFSREIAHDDVLGFLDRGSHTTLSCYPGRELDNNYSLNTVDICPVGALTSTDFRFKMRVWFLKETESLCTSCSTGCNVLLGSREGVAHRQTPRRNDAVNSDWMCDRGRLDYKWINDPRRLVQPLYHLKGRHTRRGTAPSEMQIPMEWDSALKESREKLTAARGKLGVLASGRCTTEELFLLKLIAEAHGARVTDIVPRAWPSDKILVSADRNPNTHGARLMGLTGETPGASIPAIAAGIEKGEITTLLVVHECAVRAGITAATLEKLAALVVVDLLGSETTAHAHYALAGVSHAEKRGTLINGRKRIQRFQQAFPPLGLARADWEILNALRPEGATPAFQSFEGLFREMCGRTSALASVTWNGVGGSGMDLSGAF